MAINTFKRNELKFLLNDEQYNRLVPVIHQYMNPDKYCIGGNEYGIYNVYYDTDDNYLIRNSLEKPYYKEKIRLRSYYSPAQPDDKVFLEIKKKIGGIVTKRRASMTLAQAEAFLNYGERPPESSKFIQNQVMDELVQFLKIYNVHPAQYISYQRYAFFGKEDKDFRLTFDRKITTRRYDLTLANESYGSQIIEEGQHLMEVKIIGAMPLWLAHALSELKIFKTSFSKYGRGFKAYTLEKMADNGLYVNTRSKDFVCVK
ncbi:MAG: polyphosphate polymerase domain-containing protein [Oscillospiraceae bacterium]